MTATHADAIGVLSQHVYALDYPKKVDAKDYRGHVVFEVGLNLEADPSEFFQLWLPFSLIFAADVRNPNIWLIFHHKAHDGKAVDFFSWKLGEYPCVARPDIINIFQAKSEISKICGRAYVKSYSQKRYWHLYPAFLYFLLGEIKSQTETSDEDETAGTENIA